MLQWCLSSPLTPVVRKEIGYRLKTYCVRCLHDFHSKWLQQEYTTILGRHVSKRLIHSCLIVYLCVSYNTPKSNWSWKSTQKGDSYTPNALNNLTLRASVLEVMIQADFTLRSPFTLRRHEDFYVARNIKVVLSGRNVIKRDLSGPPRPTLYDVTRPSIAQNFFASSSRLYRNHAARKISNSRRFRSSSDTR